MANAVAAEVQRLQRELFRHAVLLLCGAMGLAALAAAWWQLTAANPANEAALAASVEQYFVKNAANVRQGFARVAAARAPEIAGFAGKVVREQFPAARLQSELMFKEGVARLLAARKPALVGALKAGLKARPMLLETAPRRLADPAEAQKCLDEMAAALEPVLAAEAERTAAAAFGGVDGLAKSLAAANAEKPGTPLAEMHRDALRLVRQFVAEISAPVPASTPAP